MNIFAVWSLPTVTQRRSGPQHARVERGLRAKCITWKSLKTHRETLCFQCASQVHRFDTKTDCAPKDSMRACVGRAKNLVFHGKTEQTPPDMH